ncbi:MAG: hypothetical protein ABIA04_11950 [Pseudomonadota bacterium]
MKSYFNKIIFLIFLIISPLYISTLNANTINKKENTPESSASKAVLQDVYFEISGKTDEARLEFSNPIDFSFKYDRKKGKSQYDSLIFTIPNSECSADLTGRFLIMEGTIREILCENQRKNIIFTLEVLNASDIESMNIRDNKQVIIRLHKNSNLIKSSKNKNFSIQTMMLFGDIKLRVIGEAEDSLKLEEPKIQEPEEDSKSAREQGNKGTGKQGSKRSRTKKYFLLGINSGISVIPGNATGLGLTFGMDIGGRFGNNSISLDNNITIAEVDTAIVNYIPIHLTYRRFFPLSSWAEFNGGFGLGPLNIWTDDDFQIAASLKASLGFAFNISAIYVAPDLQFIYAFGDVLGYPYFQIAMLLKFGLRL